uniref:Zinc finger protein 462-like n=1 Tax=Salmo trutta TaxID=8032 RepID=A0A673X694_SALTR
TILSLLKNHLLKVHGGEATLLLRHRVSECNVVLISRVFSVTEPVYSEPPDVQRQLNHYRQVAQAKASSSPPSPQTTRTTQDGLFVCEFCIYTSTHIKSMRRHYINRHNGKRLVRCKDCSFFTGFRKKLDMHIETAHASSPTEAPKELHCPLCLYHTKNKNRMIDHIVLHREQPVAPIEVRRPKLSRYLEGTVFRCHKCTFTSSSDKKLLLHMLKHDDIKPYKCRLCYFDCTQLSELEAHLCDKHQVSVVRNHELVGQVHLEELETRLSRVNEEGEQFMDCEETQGQQDDVNKDGDNEVAENTAQNSEFHDFSNDENQEGQYKQSHEKLENEDKKVEEHLMDCEEENQEPGEMDIEEQNNQYHEMPVLKDEACNYHEMPVLENEEGKEETHSNHGVRQENEEEAVKTDRLKPECNKKPEQGSEQDEKYEENPKSGEKQDHEVEENNKENGNISSPKGKSILT